MVLILSRSDLERVLGIHELIGSLERAFRDQAIGKAIMPPRVSLSLKNNGWLGTMSAYLERHAAITTKIVTVFGDNPTKSLPTTMATIVLCDARTGQVLSIMDGGYITAMRTGALGGLAAKLLSRDDSQTVGIFGAGVQARTQLLALDDVRYITVVRVFDPVFERAKRFAKEMRQRIRAPIEVCNSPSELVRNSDIIVTVSTSKDPLFDGSLLREGTHLNAFGNFKPDERELDEKTVRRSKLFVDQREAALSEAGDIIIPIKTGAISEKHIRAELGELIVGSKSGRASRHDITLFKSVGLGIQDCSASFLAYTKALKLGVGKQVQIG